MQVNLTDGRLVQFGCVNTTSGQTGCNPGQLDVGIRKASFRFAPGETVTQMALFAGPDNSGRPNARAGAIRFATSLVRLVTSASERDPVPPARPPKCFVYMRRNGLTGLAALHFTPVQSVNDRLILSQVQWAVPSHWTAPCTIYPW